MLLTLFFSHHTVFAELGVFQVRGARCPELVSLCLSQVTRLGLCSPVGTRRGPRPVSLLAVALAETRFPHGTMMSVSRSALQVRLHRLWLGRSSLGRGESLTCTHYLSHLFLRSRTTATCSRCPLLLATRRLQPPVGQSWDGGNPGLAPPVALAGVCTDTCSRPHVHGRLCCTRQGTESDVSLQELITSRCVQNFDTTHFQVISGRISCLEIATLPSSFTSSNK